MSDFLPEPSSLNQVLKTSESVQQRWGVAIAKEIQGLFDNDTFGTNERPLPNDEVVPTKLTLKAKLNSYGGLDKLKARVCFRGDMQEKFQINLWSPTASIRLLKCFLADAARLDATIYQLDFIQAFIQTKTTRRIFVILDKQYEKFCPKLAQHLGRPLRLKRCLYGADFSGKAWYEALDECLREVMNFKRSMVEGCLYIYRKGNDWIKMINYVDDALYYCSSDSVRNHFETKLKSKFNLTLLGKAKWYLGMRIMQHNGFITLDQSQYTKNITSRIEKSFKNPIKVKDSPLPTGFIPTNDDSPVSEAQKDEVKHRFKNLHYRSAIGAILYMSCCTRPDVCYAVNKLAKYSNNPGIKHYKALLHLIGYLKGNNTKGLAFYTDTKQSPVYKLLKNNGIPLEANSIVEFTDSSWNDCKDTGRSTGGHLALIQGGAVDYGSHVPVPVAMSSGEAEYIAAAVACMKASHLRMLKYDLDHLGTEDYDSENMKCPPAMIIVDNEAAIAMSSCNKDTAGNRHVARRYHYVRQGTALKEHTFHWIGTKFQLADPMTKEGGPSKFKGLWDVYMVDMENYVTN